MQKELIEKETKLEDRRKAEKELNQRNEMLKLVEKDEIKVFKVIKDRGIENGHSATILQLDGDEIVLDASKYYIAEYESNEYLYCRSSSYDILLDQSDLFFILNRSSCLELKSGFYSIPAGSYAKYLDTKNRLFSDDLSSYAISGKG